MHLRGPNLENSRSASAAAKRFPLFDIIPTRIIVGTTDFLDLDLDLDLDLMYFSDRNESKTS